ncbi:MAG: hypothetical protein IJX17_01315 [Clostridia bacterium]|nr:hypothetical protein [Clostridia bacterium]
MEKRYLETYEKCLSTLGCNSQILMCIEEMSELTKELCKFYRQGEMNCSVELKNHICEEIADVQNMVDEMQFIFGIEKVDEIRKQKIDRVEKRLKEEL